MAAAHRPALATAPELGQTAAPDTGIVELEVELCFALSSTLPEVVQLLNAVLAMP